MLAAHAILHAGVEVCMLEFVFHVLLRQVSVSDPRRVQEWQILIIFVDVVFAARMTVRIIHIVI